MRIVAVNADRGIAPDGSKGAAIHLRSLLTAFRGQGHEIVLHSRRVPAGGHLLGIPVRQGVAEGEIAATIIEMDADFVFERYSLDCRQGLLAARQTRCPFGLEVNAPLFAEASRYRPSTVTERSEAIERELWREADCVFPVSSQLAELIAHCREGRCGIQVLPNGVNPQLFEGPPPARSGEPPFTLAFLGHPKPWHGCAMLPDLMEELGFRGWDVRLLVIGGGPGADELARVFQERGLSCLLQITGALPQEEAIDRLRGAHVSLAPYEESASFYFSPLKVFESLAARVPLVASDCGDIAHLTGGHALLFPPGDTEALADQVVTLLSDPPLRESLAEAGWNHNLKHHTWDANARVIVGQMAAMGSRGVDS